METKSLLIGILSFIAGALLVSVAAVTFEKDELQGPMMMSGQNMGMHSENSLQNKTGDSFDEAFISEMIVHHDGAIEMAKLANSNAKHQEIKDLSQNIISAQDKEIQEMRKWANDWNYQISTSKTGH